MKKKTKSVKVEKVVWTEVEDYFLQNNIGSKTDLELAKLLNKTKRQIVARIKKLGLKLEELTVDDKKKKALKGFAVGSFENPNQNIVSMTGGRSAQDDIKAGTMPVELGGTGEKPTGGEQYLAKFKMNIKRD